MLILILILLLPLLLLLLLLLLLPITIKTIKLNNNNKNYYYYYYYYYYYNRGFLERPSTAQGGSTERFISLIYAIRQQRYAVRLLSTILASLQQTQHSGDMQFCPVKLQFCEIQGFKGVYQATGAHYRVWKIQNSKHKVILYCPLKGNLL